MTPRAQSSVASARQGRPVASQRIQFIPEHLTLPGNATRQYTQRPRWMVSSGFRRTSGMWIGGDGSARAGEAFGSTVIAGHVDSDTYGIGFFARLLKIKVGDTVTLRGDSSHRLRYRVTSVRKVDKKALATKSQAFQQTGPHRLVLITCTGNFHRDRGGYDNNLVVVARFWY
jgi:LPXTG-site transpeptidase (sortase) family protein